MSRIPLPAPEGATGTHKESYDAIRARYGAVPNGVQTLGVSPEALRGFLGFSAALADGKLAVGERESIAILTAQHNKCGYCLSAHTLGGRAAGLTDDELAASREGRSEAPRAAAILHFARVVLEHRGEVDDADLAPARGAGLSDAELVEVIAEVALNTFTNYVNRFLQPEYDLPRIPVERLSAQ